MVGFHRRSIFTAVVIAFGLAVLGWYVADAAPPEGVPASEHARIVSYWTPDRVAGAIPRDLRVDIAPSVKPDNPGGGGGNGGGGNGKGGGGGNGGDSTLSVTGASWTGGGLVRDTVGKVLFTLDGVNYVCSGAVVEDTRAAESLVVTAGHCVYDDVADVFATNWMFVPDFQDGATFDCDATRFGCWTASALVTTTAWAAGDFNEDYAFAIMQPGGKSGQSLLLEDVVGAQAITFNETHPTTVYAFGYPHASPYDGTVLTYCAGTDVPDDWGGSEDYGLECDMTGGSSGGPWFVNFDEATGAGAINSVNSFKYLRGKYSKYMFGPYFDADTQATYSHANTAAATNALVPVP